MIDLPPRAPREVSEADLTTAILNALRLISGVHATRNNTGKTPVPCESCRKAMCRRCLARLVRPVTYGLGSGGPDVVGIYTYRPWTSDGERAVRGEVDAVALAFGVEVKKPRDVLASGRESQAEDRSAEQVAWHRAAHARGMPVWTCRTVEDAAREVRAWIARMP